MIKNGVKPLYGKIVLKGEIECLTGLHIGGSTDSLEIGGVDLPVVRHPFNREPFVPGSSLKGKMRSLLERTEQAKENSQITFNRPQQQTTKHECDDAAQAVDCPVCRVFGSTGYRGGTNLPAKLAVRDGVLLKKDDALRGTLEVKYENSIDRITAAANPRQIERVPAGTRFSFELIYDVEAQSKEDDDHNVSLNSDYLKEDIENILGMLNIIESSGLGGHVSRGSGQVKFEINVLDAYKIKYYTTSGKGNRGQYKKDFIKVPSEGQHKLPSIADYQDRGLSDKIVAFFNERIESEDNKDKDTE